MHEPDRYPDWLLALLHGEDQTDQKNIFDMRPSRSTFRGSRKAGSKAKRGESDDDDDDDSDASSYKSESEGSGDSESDEEEEEAQPHDVFALSNDDIRPEEVDRLNATYGFAIPRDVRFPRDPALYDDMKEYERKVIADIYHTAYKFWKEHNFNVGHNFAYLHKADPRATGKRPPGGGGPKTPVVRKTKAQQRADREQRAADREALRAQAQHDREARRAQAQHDHEVEDLVKNAAAALLRAGTKNRESVRKQNEKEAEKAAEKARKEKMNARKADEREQLRKMMGGPRPRKEGGAKRQRATEEDDAESKKQREADAARLAETIASNLPWMQDPSTVQYGIVEYTFEQLPQVMQEAFTPILVGMRREVDPTTGFVMYKKVYKWTKKIKGVAVHQGFHAMDLQNRRICYTSDPRVALVIYVCWHLDPNIGLQATSSRWLNWIVRRGDEAAAEWLVEHDLTEFSLKTGSGGRKQTLDHHNIEYTPAELVDAPLETPLPEGVTPAPAPAPRSKREGKRKARKAPEAPEESDDADSQRVLAAIAASLAEPSGAGPSGAGPSGAGPSGAGPSGAGPSGAAGSSSDAPENEFHLFTEEQKRMLEEIEDALEKDPDDSLTDFLS
jgi:hypothetical protein